MGELNTALQFSLKFSVGVPRIEPGLHERIDRTTGILQPDEELLCLGTKAPVHLVAGFEPTTFRM